MLLLLIEIEKAGVNPNSSQADSKDAEHEEWSSLVLFLLDQEHPRVGDSHNQLADEAESYKVCACDYYVHLCIRKITIRLCYILIWKKLHLQLFFYI